MSIWIYSNGTKIDSADQDAGRAAAMEVFDRNGADPAECHEAKAEILDFDELAGGTIASNIQMRAVIWDEAENAAVLAATKDWARVPDDLSLGLA